MKASFSNRIVLILCFLFVFVTSAQSKNFESAADKATSSYFAHSDHLIPTPAHRFQLPVNSLPAVPGAELPDDNEGEEKPGFDEDGKECAHFSFSEDQIRRSSERSLLPFSRILENRPTVSLIILHHSWKSFLI